MCQLNTGDVEACELASGREKAFTALPIEAYKPIRVGMANTPNASENTKIKERIKPRFDIDKAVSQQKQLASLRHFNLLVKALCSFSDEGACEETIPFAYPDYLELVDYTGRIAREDKKGFIDGGAPPILNRLAMTSES